MINFNKALYRRNNAGQPCVWYGVIINSNLIVQYGILGKTITKEIIKSARTAEAELATRIKDKYKKGYKMLADVADTNSLPVEEADVIAFLNTYLEHDRTTADGSMLGMLAKLYDNANNKMYAKGQRYDAQPKLNGLRGHISAVHNTGDMFRPVVLKFQSREGTYWDSLRSLETYLLSIIDPQFLELMLNENYILDGELYLFGHPVNEINHIVKDAKDPKNKLLQFWCYDVAIQDMSSKLRADVLEEYFYGYSNLITSERDHITNVDRFVIVPNYTCDSDTNATGLRNMFIDWGFEGLILRDPNADYQYGKRNSAMWKYKATTDGKFIIIDVIPEGDARPDMPLLVLKNDINNATFNVRVNGSHEYQKQILLRKDVTGRLAYVTYGERSGVKQVPFHVKEVTILES